MCGYCDFTSYFKSEIDNKIPLTKVIKKLKMSFSEDEWSYLRKLHKRQSSMKSSTMSMQSAGAISKNSVEEDSKSDTNSRVSSTAGIIKRGRGASFAV